MTHALTRFGRHCRDLRLARDKTMGDQADVLRCEINYISSVETGRLLPTEQYLRALRSWLNLSAQEYTELLKRTRASVIQFPTSKHVAKNSSSMRLFRKISRMNPGEIRNIRKKQPDEAKTDGRP
ncbi:MAG: helix-turn-helix domain-containing protein [Xanthobacteraceae bacterium]